MNNKGFSLIFAVFMLVIFSIIGTAIVTMLSTSSILSSEDLLSAQALFLAESGKEIRIMQAINGDATQNKTYYIDGYTNNGIKVTMNKIADTDNGSTSVYGIYSKGTVFNIKRKIYVEFIK